MDFNDFMATCEAEAKSGIKLTAKHKKLLKRELANTSEFAAPIIKKIHNLGQVKKGLILFMGFLKLRLMGRPVS